MPTSDQLFLTACQCSTIGSYPVPCDPGTGQCECLPGITGKRCDRCLSGAYDFPYCQGKEPAACWEHGPHLSRCSQSLGEAQRVFSTSTQATLSIWFRLPLCQHYWKHVHHTLNPRDSQCLMRTKIPTHKSSGFLSPHQRGQPDPTNLPQHCLTPHTQPLCTRVSGLSP